MEAALFLVNLVIMLLLLLWSARTDPVGQKETGAGLFAMRPGADCDHRKRPDFTYLRDE